MPHSTDSTITVIMPTLALRERSAGVRRAIDSVLHQRGVHAVPLIVVNGPQADPALVAELAARPDIRMTQLPEPNLPAALVAGRRLVDSTWFAELDDDDVLLPNALALRLEILQADDELGAVVSNGIIRRGRKEWPAVDDTTQVAEDPLGRLGTQNWLSPGAALFRSDSVPVALFDGMPQFLEWTYLAARLAQTCKLAFIEEPGFVHHIDSPASTWNSAACSQGLPHAMQHLLALDLPADLRPAFARRLTSARNAAANAALRDGRLGVAWRWHLRCLTGVNGWRYLPFTRILLRGLFSRGSTTS